MSSKSRPVSLKRRSDSIMGMAFFGPALVLLTLFLFLPMVLTFIYSFTDYFALSPNTTHFVGLENFAKLFGDELFVTSFLNTVKFVVIIVPLQCLGALGLALLINKVTYCKKYFKVAFFIPVVMSLAVVSTLWMQIYSPEGILNTLLTNMGFNPQPFIHSANQALPSIAIMSAWQGMGYQMIIFLGGLQAINPALYEAATIDGANRFQRIWYITIPGIMNMIAIQFVLRVGAVMEGGFDQIFNLYTAPVYDTGDIIDTYIYRLSFVKSSGVNLGFPTAVGLFKNVINFILLMLANGVTRALGQETVL